MKTREERRQEMVAKHKVWAAQVAASVRPGTVEEVQAAVRKTNLAYLFDRSPIKKFTTTKELNFTVYHACTQSRVTLPAGTEGHLYVNVENTYDKYVWVNDEQYPAKDAKVTATTTYYQVCAIVRVEGEDVLAECFEVVRK